MKKIIVVLLLALLACSAFAESKISSSWEKSYYKDNDINLYASVGWVYGLCAAVHGEWIISEFPIPECPLDFGVMLNVGYDMLYGGVSVIGIAPTFTVHLGLKSIPIEFFAGLGVGFGIVVAGNYGGAGFSFATVDGFVWHFSDMFGLFVEFSWIGSVAWGVGIQVSF
jgi:hypothetical protein